MTSERFESLQLDIDTVSRMYAVGYLMNLEDDNLIVRFQIPSEVLKDEPASSPEYIEAVR